MTAELLVTVRYGSNKIKLAFDAPTYFTLLIYLLIYLVTLTLKILASKFEPQAYSCYMQRLFYGA